MHEEECIEIDNKVYVFTDISSFDFDFIDDCDLMYDVEALIPVYDKKSKLDYITDSVLQDMKNRKLSLTQYELLKGYLSKIDFVSLNRSHTVINKLDDAVFDEYRKLKDAVFNEFVWRLALYGKGIYTEGETKEVNDKRKRSRVQDSHSLLREYDRHGSLDYIHFFAEKLDDALYYNQTATANKLFYEFLEKNDNTFFLDEFRGEQLLSDAISIYEDKIEYLLSLRTNYTFFKNPYSKEYRLYFGKRKKLYSLFNTQQIMRKLKNEYHSIDDMVNSLRKEYNKTVTSMNTIQEAIKNYKKDLGDNQLPNQGFGFSGDGWDGGSDEDDLWHQIREEKDVEIEMEAIQKKEAENWDKYGPTEEAIREQEQTLHASQMELFEFDDEKYFECYESISIKDILEIKMLDVIDDVSLEGNFFSLKEIDDWLEKRLFCFSFTEFDKSELEIG